MTMRITYPDGSTEIIPEAIRVDQQNFHEGMYDFYDERSVLLKQIDMHSGIKWELVDELSKPLRPRITRRIGLDKVDSHIHAPSPAKRR